MSFYFQPRARNRNMTANPTMAAAGRVNIQAQKILFTMPRRNTLKPLVVPTPPTAAVIVWVVETGNPQAAAAVRMVAAVVSAAKP